MLFSRSWGRGGGNQMNDLQKALLFFCLEHVITVHRQRPDLSSPDCLQTLRRQTPELSSAERTGWAEVGCSLHTYMYGLKNHGPGA